MTANQVRTTSAVHRFAILFWLDKRRLKSPTDPAPIFVRITRDGVPCGWKTD
jgi:hypothetical protein